MTSHFCVEEPERVQADIPRPVGANYHPRQGPHGKGEARTAWLSVPGPGAGMALSAPPCHQEGHLPLLPCEASLCGGCGGHGGCWASSPTSAPRVGELPTRTWPWGWGTWPWGWGAWPAQSRRRARPQVKDGQKTRALSFARRKSLSQDGMGWPFFVPNCSPLPS